MISAWRIDKRQHAAGAFSGEGAFLCEGRWNPRGVRVVYAAQSLALAALEKLVHLQNGAFGLEFVCFRIDIPESVKIHGLDLARLPRDWRAVPARPSTQKLGLALALGNETAVLRVPSTLIPLEHNYLFNPAHPHFKHLRIHRPEPFSFDPRLTQ